MFYLYKSLNLLIYSMKKILFYALMFASLGLQAQTVTITQQAGWLESAYVTWNHVSGADSYNVYYSGGGLTNQLIDTQLVRSYGSYYRADVLGLAAGNYTIAVAPVTGGVEGTATVSGSITVLPHDRNGFAHANGHIPGAYKLDGTLKENAVVIYITQNTKNTISMTVQGANSNPCVGLQTILDGFKKGSDDRPLAVRLIGNITDPAYTLNGDIVIENKNNIDGSITFEGVGNDAVANGWGLRIKKGTNIEVRNLGFMLTNADEGDNVGLQQDNDYIWVHNCDMFYGAPGGDADQAKGDGALDCKKSTFVTFSYNHFWDSGKCNLLGLGEGTTSGLYVTYHHNWYDHSDSRHPRVRYYSAHVYNNYFDGNAKYGVGSTLGSSVFVEGNFFRHCKYPMLISQQGTDVYNGAVGTFSGEDGGIIKAYNNDISGETRFKPYDVVNYPVEFDAYVTTTRNQIVPSGINSKEGGNAYNNFDTNTTLYVNSLVPDSPTVARDKTMQYSGRVGGGDLSWTFNNDVDDTSYAVNAGLLAMLQSYTSGLVSIQGDESTGTSTQTLTAPANTDQTVAEGVAIEDMVYTWGGTANDANVSGLPANGIDFVKDMGAHTITVFGTPTANVNFTVTTTGTAGASVTASGTVSILGLPSGDEIHNFTASGLNSTFYTFTNANMNSNPGSATYDGLNLTARLKIESATNISYTTNAPSTLTLVFDPTFSGNIKLNGTNYAATNGVVVIESVPVGLNNITKGNTTNLYYMKTHFESMGVEQSAKQKAVLYPNPVSNELFITMPQGIAVEEVTVYNLYGQLVQRTGGDVKSVNVANLSAGSYIVKIQSANGVTEQRVIKN